MDTISDKLELISKVAQVTQPLKRMDEVGGRAWDSIRKILVRENTMIFCLSRVGSKVQKRNDD